MAKLIITRSSEWMNRARLISVYIDGRQVDYIGNGETKQFELPEGIHTVKARIDWCGSSDFTLDISDGQPKSIFLSSFSYNNNITLVLFAVFALHFILHYVLHIDYLIWIALLILPVVVYYLTAGRNQYLKIKELS